MDVSRPLRGLGLVVFLLLSACGNDDRTVETIFPEPDICAETNISNRFLVHWTNGSITLELAEDRETFINEFLSEKLEEIEYVQHDQWIEPIQNTEDIITSNSLFAAAPIYGPEQIEADSAWSSGIRGDGVTIAVIDSGVDISHPKLASQISYNDGESGFDSNGADKSTNGIDDDGNGYVDDYAGYDFYDHQPLAQTINSSDSHGTHVSGIIASAHNDQSIDNSKVQGVAPAAKILPLKFIGPAGGQLSDALLAIDYAVAQGAKIINASWGGSTCSKSLERKLQTLTQSGVLFVTAAGNSSSNIDKLLEFPASFNMPSQITVGSVTKDLHTAEHSNYGDLRVHVFAPGHRIVSTLPNGETGEMTGTSMATPFVSGVAALLMSSYPSASIGEIRSAILNSTTHDPFYRNATQGRINVTNALQYLAAQ